jgi:hypothetical protein
MPAAGCMRTRDRDKAERCSCRMEVCAPRHPSEAIFGFFCAVRSRDRRWLTARCRASVAGFTVALLFWAGLGPFRASAEEIDRLLLAVNGKVITDTDLKLARSLNDILISHKTDSGPSRAEEMQRLVDLELLRQELESFPGAPERKADVENQMEELRKSYADRGGLVPVLQKLGLQESELREYLGLQASVMEFIDFRFRPFANVSGEEIQKYYVEQLVPQLRKSGAAVPALEDVSSKISAILTEEKIDVLLRQWLQDTLRHSKIEYFDENPAVPGR